MATNAGTASHMSLDREEVLRSLGTTGPGWSGALKSCSSELYSDRDFMLQAVKRNGLSLQYASDELRSDRELVLEAVKRSAQALTYADRAFRSDKEVMLELVKQNGLDLKRVAAELRSDRDVVLAAVKQRGLALCHAAEGLRSDREIVLEAVKQNGRALEFARHFDREIALEAVKNNGRAFELAAEYQSDREVVLEAVNQWGGALFFAGDYRSDRDVVLVAARSENKEGYGDATQFAPPKLWKDRGFQAAVNSCIAAAGSHAPVFTIDAIVMGVADGMEVHLHTMAGEERAVSMEQTATIGDLARDLVQRLPGKGCRYTFLVLSEPGQESVTPWMHERRLSDVANAAT